MLGQYLLVDPQGNHAKTFEECAKKQLSEFMWLDILQQRFHLRSISWISNHSLPLVHIAICVNAGISFRLRLEIDKVIPGTSIVCDLKIVIGLYNVKEYCLGRILWVCQLACSDMFNRETWHLARKGQDTNEAAREAIASS